MRDNHSSEAPQMKLLRQLLEFTKRNHQSDTDIKKNLQAQNMVLDKHDYQETWKKKVQTVQRNRLPKSVRYCTINLMANET